MTAVWTVEKARFVFAPSPWSFDVVIHKVWRL